VNTKMLMGLSAMFMAMLGVVASFLPQEILAYAGSRPEGLGVLLIQVNGALYMGFAILNWMARANLIGGIYSRPVALGNFMHFAVVGIALSKALLAGQRGPEVVVGFVGYSVFAIWFGLILFKHPRPVQTTA